MTTATPHRVDPVAIGPTWQRNEAGQFVIPSRKRTLGYGILGWTHQWLQQPDGPNAGEPWQYTAEQARWLLHWFAIDKNGRWVNRRGVLRRPKGWGKDPVADTLAAVEGLGPCRFGGWTPDGFPIALPRTTTWVQIAAVSQDQTRTSMTLFPSLFTDAAVSEFGLDIGKTVVYARGGRCRIEAVTSSPRAMEGARPDLTIKNETEHWLKSNEGHGMSAVIARNAAKVGGRVLGICNAHNPGEDSIGERDYEAYLKIASGASRATGLMYDALEAPPETVLADERSLRAGLAAAYGDSVWVDLERLIAEIYDPETSPSDSRRFYLNQVVAAEDSWTTPQQWGVNGDPKRTLEKGDQIAMFFDGSKSEDTTGLVAARISDGVVFRLGDWAKPQHVEGWQVPRDQVDDRVENAFAQYDVVGFFGDPGAGDDDETGARYWDALLDKWGREHGDTLCAWAQPFGTGRHAVLWDMRDPNHAKEFTAAVERALDDIVSEQLPHDGDIKLAQHVANARRWPNKYGVTMGKESRSSTRKIDLAVCAVGARMVRRLYLALPENKKRKKRGSISLYVPGEVTE